MKKNKNSMDGPVFLASGAGSVGRIECMRCHASIIIKDIDSHAWKRLTRRFLRNHRQCVRKKPSKHEFEKATERANRELSTYDN